MTKRRRLALLQKYKTLIVFLTFCLSSTQGFHGRVCVLLDTQVQYSLNFIAYLLLKITITSILLSKVTILLKRNYNTYYILVELYTADFSLFDYNSAEFNLHHET